MMPKKNTLTKILSVTGTIFALLPLLAPVMYSLLTLPRRGFFHFDWLMPAELFPAAILGGALLIAAAFITHAHRKMIVWSYAVMILTLVGGQALAVITGLASGETGPAGWPWVLVIASLITYSIALVAICAGGVMLVKELFKPSK